MIVLITIGGGLLAWIFDLNGAIVSPGYFWALGFFTGLGAAMLMRFKLISKQT